MSRNRKQKATRRQTKQNKKNVTRKVTSSVFQLARRRSEAAALRFVEQLRHPFEVPHLQRGPFGGQPTGITRSIIRGTIAAPATGFVGVIATPSFSYTALTWSPAAINGNIAVGDFTANGFPNQTAITNTFGSIRPLAMAMRCSAVGSATTITGACYSGLLDPSMVVVGVSYNNFLSYDNFRVTHATIPSEVLWTPEAGVGYTGMEFNSGTYASVTTALADTRYAFPCIFFSGYPSGVSINYEVCMIFEGQLLNNLTGIVPTEESELLSEEFDIAVRDHCRSQGRKFVRSGMSALDDGADEIDAKEEDGGYASYIPAMSAVGGFAATVASGMITRQMNRPGSMGNAARRPRV